MSATVTGGVSAPAGSAPLHAAAYNGHIDIINMLISSGANVNSTNRIGQTALHISAQYGYIDIVRSLLDAGADRTIRDNDGHTAVDLAKYHARVPVNSDNSIG
tara:strand:+ start:53790 stop:54098 length:309 start_codon:yes stop_codon:yes gene_type:complete